MSGGFGYKNGSYIVQAVADYANYKERQKDKAYERQRQEQLDNEAREQREYQRKRQDMLDDRAGESHELSLKQGKLSIAEMERREKDYKRGLEKEEAAKERRANYAGGLLGIGGEGRTIGGEARDVTPTAAPEQMPEEAPKLPLQERLNSTIGMGASGKGKGIVTTEDATTGDILLSITREDGKTAPLTGNPHDDKSAQLRVKPEDAAEMEAHVERSADQAEKHGLEGTKQAAYIRAATTADDDGYIRPATESEFMANLKAQGLLKAITGEKVLPHKQPEPKEPSMLESVKAKMDDINVDVGEKGAVDYAKDAYEGGNRGAKQLYNVFVRGDYIKQSGVSDMVKRVGSSLLFGTKKSVKVDENSEVKVKATKSVTTPEGIDDVVKAKEAIDKGVSEAGAEPPKRSAQVEKILEGEESISAGGAPNEPQVQGERMVKIRDNHPRFEKQAAILAEMFIHGDVGLKELHNFRETGDIRYSQEDLNNQTIKLETARATNTARVLEQQKGILAKSVEMQKEVNKANAEAKKKGVDHVKEHREVLQDIGANAVDEYMGSANYRGSNKITDADVRKSLTAKLNRLSDQLLATKVYGDELYSSAGGRVQLHEAIKAYLMENGSNAAITVESLTPYMTMVGGRYKVATSKTIAQASKIAQRPMSEIREKYNAEYEKSSSGFKEGKVKGPNGEALEWSESSQKMFDSIFLDELLKSQGR